jgi:hypothetical protein
MRGIAVLGVLIFHADLMKGGYLGVDLFFVLSGFLITSLILSEWRKTGGLNLKGFWIRRSRRLLPALLMLLVGVAFYCAFLALPGELERIRADALATLLYVANWRRIFSGQSYWAIFQTPSPLDHTWSLAIEEQFYLIWPFLVFVLLRVTKGSARHLLAMCLGGAALSMAAMWFLFDPANSSRAYMGSDTRAAAILFGAALACVFELFGSLRNQRSIQILDALGVLCVVGLTVAWIWLPGESPFLYRGGFWLCEAGVIVVIACCAHGDRSVISKCFGIGPLVALGTLSYGLYLWHWPIFVILNSERTGLSGWVLFALRFSLTFLIAAASFYFIEQPIRKNGLPKWIRPAIAVPLVGVFVVALIVISTFGAVPSEVANGSSADAQDFDQTTATGAREKVLIIGDSVADTFGARMRKAAGPNVGVAVRAVIGCSLLARDYPTTAFGVPQPGGNCAKGWVKDVAELKPTKTVIILGGGMNATAKIDGKSQRTCDKSWDDSYQKDLTADLKSLSGTAGKIYLVLVPPATGQYAEVSTPEQNACLNVILRNAHAAVPATTLIDLKGSLCPNGVCQEKSQGRPIRADGLHWQDDLAAGASVDWMFQKLGVKR